VIDSSQETGEEKIKEQQKQSRDFDTSAALSAYTRMPFVNL